MLNRLCCNEDVIAFLESVDPAEVCMRKLIKINQSSCNDMLSSMPCVPTKVALGTSEPPKTIIL